MRDQEWLESRSPHLFIGWLILVFGCFAWCGTTVEALEFNVSKTADTNDIFCAAGPPEPPPFDCSLREAIMKSNAIAGKDTIRIPAGTYTLTREGRDEDAAATGDLDITDDVEIIGAGAFGAIGSQTLINAASIDRVFHVHQDARADLHGLHIRRGDAQGGTIKSGGGIFNEGGKVYLWNSILFLNYAKDGGGIKGIGFGAITTVVSSYLGANSASRNGGGIDQQQGTLLAVRSTFADNVADKEGGAVYLNGPVASLINVTLADNHAGDPAGGGGLFDLDSTTTIDSCTFSGNTPYDLASLPDPGSVRVRNTIVNGACEAVMVITEEGNVEGPGDTCGFKNPGDYTAIPVGLLPLDYYGSLIKTMPPFAGKASLAVDNDWADPACQAVDQRGVSRPKDDDHDGDAVCDSGAVERIFSDPLMMDGFESGDISAWSRTVP